MINLKKTKGRLSTVHLLDTLGTKNPNFNQIIDSILHTIYNRPLTEKSPKDSRVAMLFNGKGKSHKFRSTKAIPTNVRSLSMKIKRSNLVAHEIICEEMVGHL